MTNRIMGTRSPELAEDREVLDTQSMIESAFISGLSGSTQKQLQKSAPMVATASTASGESTATVDTSQYMKTASTEKLLVNLYNVRDGLVSSFSKVPITSSLASDLTNHINSLGACILELGGDVDDFTALDHVSGLTAPNMNKNASQVVETTKECYSIGRIRNSSIADGGRKIFMSFEGKEGDVEFLAEGEITVKSAAWNGNEAIDYVYTPGAGKMSVKAFEGDTWIDKSNDFIVNWNLFEGDVEKAVAQRDAELKAERAKKTQEMATKTTTAVVQSIKSTAPVAKEVSDNDLPDDKFQEKYNGPDLANEDDPDLADFPVQDGA